MGPSRALAIVLLGAALSTLAAAGCGSLNGLECSTANKRVQAANGCEWGCTCSTTGSTSPALSYTCGLTDDNPRNPTAPVPYFAWVNVSSTDKAASSYAVAVDGSSVLSGTMTAAAGTTTTNVTGVLLTAPVASNLTAAFTYDTTNAGAGATGGFTGGIFQCRTVTGGSTQQFTPKGTSGGFGFIADAHSGSHFTYNLYRRNTTHPDLQLMSTDISGEVVVFGYELPFACGSTVYEVETVLSVPGAPALVCPERTSSPVFNTSTSPSRPTELSVTALSNTTLQASWLSGYSGGCGPSTFTVTGVPPNPADGQPVTVTETIPYQYAEGTKISIPIDMGKCYELVTIALSVENMHGHTGQIYGELRRSCPGDKPSGLTTGEKAGIGVAVVVVVLGAAGLVFWYRRRNSKRAEYDAF